MKVNEYIYRNWANWNFAILKELCEDEGIEWSEELVEYLKNSPGNTNWNLLVDFGIEPYGTDGEEELSTQYLIAYANQYVITNANNVILAVTNPNKIIGKVYDFYTDIETGYVYSDPTQTSGTPEYMGFRVDNLTDGIDVEINIIDTAGTRWGKRFACAYRYSSTGEFYNDDSGSVYICEPDHDKGLVNGLIQFAVEENPDETSD